MWSALKVGSADAYMHVPFTMCMQLQCKFHLTLQCIALQCEAALVWSGLRRAAAAAAAGAGAAGGGRDATNPRVVSGDKTPLMRSTVFHSTLLCNDKYKYKCKCKFWSGV